MTPTLRQLEYVVALARELNFRQAAAGCHVSQPALSSQIQQLEAQLGVVLFERDKRSVQITPAGEELAGRAQKILDQVEEMVASVQGTTGKLVGSLRMGVIPTVAPYMLPNFVGEVHEKFPDLKLYLREEQTSRCVEQIERGELDVALLALEADLGDLHTVPLFEDPFMVVLSPGHPLAERDEIKEEDLAKERLLLLEEGHCLRAQVLKLCEHAATEDLDILGGTSLTTLMQMVNSDMGITLLPQMAVEKEVASASGVIVKPMPEPRPYRTIGLVCRDKSPRAADFDALADLLEELLGTLDGGLAHAG